MRERERGTETERQIDRQTDRQTETETHREKEGRGSLCVNERERERR